MAANSSSTVVRAGFFVGILILSAVVGTVAIGGGGGSQAAPDVTQVNAPSFNSDESVATPAAESGDLSMSADASGKVVVIDVAHAGDIDREALTPLVSTLTENGATVRYHVGERQSGSPLNESLRSADAFVVLGAEQRYTESEMNGLTAFSDAGGRVLLLNEPSQASPAGLGLFGPVRSDSVTMPMAPLASQYGLSYGNGYLYNMHEYDTNYQNVYATPTGDTELTEGVDRTVFYAALPVQGGDTVVTTTEQTTLSKTRRQDTYGVVARSGNVVTVGDTNVFTQEFLYRADNEQLVGNLLDFLVTGEKSPADAPQPADSGESGPGGSLPGAGTGGGGALPSEPDSTPAPEPNETMRADQ
ncbi:DUF4350 domain-containing protein [Haloarcula sp. KBTZ06]|uniref:DUF4350 domain-containing protein n=1 Tax=Haloarcula hispanica TaxID=51589 RepID=A0A5J5LI41_HALHI|nr:MULTISPECIES: DUF4350 domain-containing protein [Haloarcula]AJF25966.1 hypothetical protein SG26_09640 [Haloarcula sp. CBA1115]KAA9405395.1 hypothetical protein Har1131_00645 [Haloarcula sp. CBA1131]KAA9408726.1 hypothetical protein EGO51_02650 [Haloarcula hispanica]